MHPAPFTHTDLINQLSCWAGFTVLTTPLNAVLYHLIIDAEYAGNSLVTYAVVSAIVTVAIIASTPSSKAAAATSEPDDRLPWEYNIQRVTAYWSRRPVAVARRTVAVALAAFAIGVGLLVDRARGIASSQCVVMAS